MKSTVALYGVNPKELKSLAYVTQELFADLESNMDDEIEKLYPCLNRCKEQDSDTYI